MVYNKWEGALSMVEMHTLHIRNLDDETYKLLWNLRKKLKASSWADLMKKVCTAYKEEIEEFEWL